MNKAAFYSSVLVKSVTNHKKHCHQRKENEKFTVSLSREVDRGSLKVLTTSTGGGLSKMLNALIASDFIVSYIPFGESKRDEHYRLTDPFCLFYQRFVKGRKTLADNFWAQNIDSAPINIWRGITFEEICLLHVPQIKRALGISGVSSNQATWSIKGDESNSGVQIDMVIDRKDNVVNMCEMKFYNEEFCVNKAYHAILVHRQKLLSEHLSRRKVIHPTLVTTYGLKYNEYSGDFPKVVTLDDLFSNA